MDASRRVFALFLLAGCTPRGAEQSELRGHQSAEQAKRPVVEPERPPPTLAERRPPLTGLTMIAPGVHHSCALEGGRVLCWGLNRFDILGVGPDLPQYSTTPRPVVGLDEAGPIVQVATDYDFSCALADDGSVYCWGDNDRAQLGVGDIVRRARPTKVAGVSAARLDLGFAHGCALAGDRRQVWCWGEGELGDGQRRERQPKALEIAALAGVDQLANPGSHGCWLRAGAMRCWGNNSGGQIGNGEGGCEYDEPLCADCGRLPSQTCKRADQPTAPLGLPKIAAIAAGCHYSYALDREGGVWQWGQVGETMSFDEKPNYRPQLVVGLPPVVELSAGCSHACARTDDGELWCWGNNSFGQLGLENKDPFDGEHPTPHRVEGLPPASAVAAGFYFSCAITGEGEDTRAWCWGDNGNGQLGDGTTERRHSPAPVVAAAI